MCVDGVGPGPSVLYEYCAYVYLLHMFTHVHRCAMHMCNCIAIIVISVVNIISTIGRLLNCFVLIQKLSQSTFYIAHM